MLCMALGIGLTGAVGEWRKVKHTGPCTEKLGWSSMDSDGEATTIVLLQASCFISYNWTGRQSYCIQLEKETELASLGRNSLCKKSLQALDIQGDKAIEHTLCTHCQYLHSKPGKALPSLWAPPGIWGFQFIAGCYPLCGTFKNTFRMTRYPGDQGF